jgi:hypothetical protein
VVTGLRKHVRLLLILGGVVAAVLLFEAVVRLFHIDYELSPNWKYHPVLGWSQTPNARYDFVIDGRPVHVAFNSLGFRDDEHRREKPAGVRRVVVIGDSFCEAVQVNLEQTFFRVLQDRLNASGLDRWEVINLGVGDFGGAQEWLALDEYGVSFSPDLVIQEVFPLNDVCNNAIGLYGLCASDNDRYRPYFVERDGGLKLTSPQPVRSFLRRHSAAWGVAEHAALRLAPADPEARFRCGMRPEPLLQTFADDRDQDPRVQDGWRITEEILDATALLARSHGAKYLAVVVPFESQIGGWPPPGAGQVALGVDYPERRLAGHAGATGVEILPLLPVFQQRTAEVMPYVDGHLSAGGHRVAADAIYARLVGLGWVSAR